MPSSFTAAQWRSFLLALIPLDPYDLLDAIAEFYRDEDENDQRTDEEVLAATIASLADDKLTGFALRLAFTGHASIPRENEIDLLTEAEKVFFPPTDKKKTSKKAASKSAKSTRKPHTPIKSATAKTATKKNVAA